MAARPPHVYENFNFSRKLSRPESSDLSEDGLDEIDLSGLQCPELRVVADYEAENTDELSLCRGSYVKLLSKDDRISGTDGWWVGVMDGRLGVFPKACVSSEYTRFDGKELKPKTSAHEMPLEIPFDQLDLSGADLIGTG